LPSRPIGNVPLHIPTTWMLTGSVAKAGEGASIAPTMLAVVIMMMLLESPSACATARMTALRRARRSPASAALVSAIATIEGLTRKARDLYPPRRGVASPSGAGQM
jgi:hypothetical protein